MPLHLNLDPALRAHLTETAQALYNRDEAAAQRCMSQVSALSPETERMIYRKLWELAGSPTHQSHPETAHRHYGRVAFRNLEGRTAPIQQKIKAVETVLSTLVHNAQQNREIPLLPTPEGAERVQYNTFFDPGFDPRFSEDGNFYLTAPSRPLSELFTTIQEVVATILFTLKAYLSFDSEERNLRQLILSSAKLEREHSSYSYAAHMNFDGFHSVGYAEHEFFERVSDLFKAAFPDVTHPQRLFPSEVLHAIHAVNKPQMNSWSAEQAIPFPWDNGDLDRSASWGFFRLCAGLYSYPTQLDRFEHNYIPHYLFIHATKQSSADLKIACRTLRTALSEITIDMTSAHSLAQCQEKIAPQLQRVKQCWDRYTESHELHTEVQSVFSQKDHYAKEIEVWHFERLIPSCLKRIYEDYNLSQGNRSNHFQDEANREGFRSLEEAYAGPFRNTLTGRILVARQPQTQTA